MTTGCDRILHNGGACMRKKNGMKNVPGRSWNDRRIPV